MLNVIELFIWGYDFSRAITIGTSMPAILIEIIVTIALSVFAKQYKKNRLIGCSLVVIFVALSVFVNFNYHTETIDAYGKSLYYGFAENGHANGRGRLYDSERNLIYIGGFKNDRYHGKGKEIEQVVVNGKVKHYVVYNGEFRNGRKDGNGKDYYFNQEVNKVLCFYRGDYYQGKRNGQGTYYYHDDSEKIYTGCFVNNIASGFGTLTYKDEEDISCKYIGAFFGDRCNGWGQIFYNDVLVYEGYWFEHARNGAGKSYYDNGVLHYDGNYVNGRYEGQGTLYDERGRLNYQGGFSQGEKDGAGILYDENGEVLREGIWENGTFVEENAAA